MSLESFNFIDSLNASNPTTTDNVSEGDDHIRGIKSTLKTTFPNINAAITATDEELNYVDGVTSNIQTQLGTKLPLAGGTMTGDVSLGDNVKAKFGAGDDLQIYHDGGNSVIKDNGVGDLYIMGESSIRLTNNNAVNHYAKFNNGGSVQLYHNNSIKLATTVGGIGITGEATASVRYLTATGNSNSGYQFTGDGDTGMHSSANNILQFSTGGSERLRITSAGNVGIGTSSPTLPLSIAGAGGTGSQTGAYMVVDIYDTTAGDINVGGGIGFRGNDGANSNVAFGVIAGLKENSTSGDYASYLSFKSRASSSALTERMRISSTGNVGIGTTNPNERLSVVAEDDASPADNGLSIYRSVGDDKVTINCQGGAAKFIADGGSAHMASIFYSYNGSTLSEHLRVEATGDVKVPIGNLVIGTSGKGIDFSATSDGSGTMTSEVLDDYEEGTWSGNVVTGTATVANETYTKIGRSVTVTGNIYSFSDITTDIEIIVTGLPYVVNSSSLGAIGGRGIPLGKGYAAIGTNGQSQFKIMEQSNTTAYTFMKHSALIYASSSSTKMYFSFTYESN